jgi:hypothetical protein
MQQTSKFSKIIGAAALIFGLLAVAQVAVAQGFDLVILNGRVMDPETMFDDIATVGIEDARRIIDERRFDYNYCRPHSSLGGKPPAEFAVQSGPRPATPSSVLIAAPTGAHEEDQPC